MDWDQLTSGGVTLEISILPFFFVLTVARGILIVARILPVHGLLTLRRPVLLELNPHRQLGRLGVLVDVGSAFLNSSILEHKEKFILDPDLNWGKRSSSQFRER